MKLNGNTILITGGATGIGLAFAKKFVELGNKVIVAGRRQDRLDEAVKSTPGLIAIKGDVGDTAGVIALGTKVLVDHPEIDIILAGPMRLNALLIEQLLAKKRIIKFLSSGLAWVPLMGGPIYCATK